MKAYFAQTHNPWSLLFGSFVVYRIRGEGGHPLTPKEIHETKVPRLQHLQGFSKPELWKEGGLACAWTDTSCCSSGLGPLPGRRCSRVFILCLHSKPGGFAVLPREWWFDVAFSFIAPAFPHYFLTTVTPKGGSAMRDTTSRAYLLSLSWWLSPPLSLPIPIGYV